MNMKWDGNFKMPIVVERLKWWERLIKLLFNWRLER